MWPFKKKCEHKWVKNRQVYVPRRHGFEVKGIPYVEIMKLSGGYTSVELMCTRCGDIKERILQGDHSR